MPLHMQNSAGFTQIAISRRIMVLDATLGDAVDNLADRQIRMDDILLPRNSMR
jgi:hypothetical protein